MTDLLSAERHFAFGKNWQSFLSVLDQERIAEAELGLRRLFPNGELKGKTFLDIGSGSGLSSLAALRLGASRVVSVDIDTHSVEATTSLRDSLAPDAPWTVERCSVFDLPADKYDVVYSWGVLHHTGDMWRAIAKAADAVSPGGLFAVALYRKTPACGFWTAEKRLYSGSPQWLQGLIRRAYIAAWTFNERRHGRDPETKKQAVKSKRGMSWTHDVHDWLGGYPYQSVRPEEVHAFMRGLGFRSQREFVEPGVGIWGSGCDEFVFRR